MFTIAREIILKQNAALVTKIIILRTLFLSIYFEN